MTGWSGAAQAIPDRDTEALIFRQMADRIWSVADDLEKGRLRHAASGLKDLARGFAALANEVD